MSNTPTAEELQNLNDDLQAEVDDLSQKVCDKCNGDGWNYNRVEGRHECVCVREKEPYQIMLENARFLAKMLVCEWYGSTVDDNERKKLDQIITSLGWVGGLSEDTYYEMAEEYEDPHDQ